MDLRNFQECLEENGAGEGNRTLVFSLEGFRRLNAVNDHSDKSTRNPPLRTKDYPDLSEGVIQRDDGLFQLGIGDDGPFPNRRFAKAVAAVVVAA